MSSVSPSSIIGLLVALAQAFFSNNPAAEDVEEFLEALIPAIAAVTNNQTATIGPVRVADSTVSVTIAPYQAPSA